MSTRTKKLILDTTQQRVYDFMRELAAGAFLVLFLTGAVFMIRQELKNQEQKQREAVILAEIADLKKQARINAQDVDFLEKLVIEGKQ